MRQHYLFSTIAIISLVGCGGDGPATYPVEGRITFADGKPLAGGVVEFQPADKQTESFSSRGRIQPDGTYQMSTFAANDGVVAGKHRVLVSPPLPPGPIDPMKRPKPVIHPRFERYDTSGLEYTVTEEGPNTFDITIERPR
jgi:hypothetical protein